MAVAPSICMTCTAAPAGITALASSGRAVHSSPADVHQAGPGGHLVHDVAGAPGERVHAEPFQSRPSQVPGRDRPQQHHPGRRGQREHQQLHGRGQPDPGNACGEQRGATQDVRARRSG